MRMLVRALQAPLTGIRIDWDEFAADIREGKGRLAQQRTKRFLFALHLLFWLFVRRVAVGDEVSEEVSARLPGRSLLRVRRQGKRTTARDFVGSRFSHFILTVGVGGLERAGRRAAAGRRRGRRRRERGRRRRGRRRGRRRTRRRGKGRRAGTR